MPTIDTENQVVELRILAMGGASDFLLASLPLDASSAMRLPELRGWRSVLHFRGASVDPWAQGGEEAQALRVFLAEVDGIILTDSLEGGRHYSSGALERLQRELSPIRLSPPTAVFGFDGLAQEWSSLTGVRVVEVVEPAAVNALRVVKSLAAVLLRSRVHTIPPPASRKG